MPNPQSLEGHRSLTLICSWTVSQNTWPEHVASISVMVRETLYYYVQGTDSPEKIPTEGPCSCCIYVSLGVKGHPGGLF